MRKRLGEILVSAGVIDDLQLRSALAEAARWGKRIGEVLVARAQCTEGQILDALASQMGVAVAPLRSTTVIAPRVLRLLPPNFARERQVLPLALDGRTSTLDVALADPASYELIDELRFRTGHEVRPLVATPRDLAEAIEHFYFGATRFPTAAFPAATDSIEVPATSEEVEEDPADLFEHRIPTGDIARRPSGEVPVAAPARSGESARASVESPRSSVESPRASVESPRASVERPIARTAPFPAPLQNRPSTTGVRVQRTAGDSMEGGGASPGRAAPIPPEATPVRVDPSGNEVARLHMQIADLQSRLDRVYGILREAAIAHRTLLSELAERGLIDRASHTKRVREQLLAGSNEGEPR